MTLPFSQRTAAIIMAGISAGILFSASAYNVAGGVLFVYLPALPLLLLGLSFGAQSTFLAACLAALVTMCLASPEDGVSFVLFLALPTFYLAQRSLLWRGEPDAREWYPMTAIVTELTALAAGLFMMIAILAAGKGGGNLQEMIANTLAGSITSPDPQIAGLIKLLTGEWSFLLFAITGWSWVLIIYGFAALAGALLDSKGLALRKHMGLTPGGVPIWLFALVVLSAALAFVGQGNDRFVARTLFLLLLLPYFLSGLATLHVKTRQWRGQMLWLALFYMTLILSLWPALLAVCAGLYTQLAEMLDKWHRMG